MIKSVSFATHKVSARTFNHNTKNKSAAYNGALEVSTEATLIAASIVSGLKPRSSVDKFGRENDPHTLNIETDGFSEMLVLNYMTSHPITANFTRSHLSVTYFVCFDSTH
jgi:hypothetical protein